MVKFTNVVNKPFICLEDIMGNPIHGLNWVVCNFSLEPKRRMVELQRMVWKIFRKPLLQTQLDELSKYNPSTADQFIKKLRSYIFNTECTQ